MNFANVKAITIPEGNVNQITDGNGVILWKAVTGPDYTEPFYVENDTGSSITVKVLRNNNLAPTITAQYSYNKVNWYNVDLTTGLSVAKNTKVYFRATSSRNGSWCSQYTSYFAYFSGLTKVGGNIMSLVYGSNFTGQETTFPESFTYNFNGLFMNNTSLTDAENLLLPATTLTTGCYSQMFKGCTYLTKVPELPATTLVNQCYQQMFYGCSYLTKAPELPATTLVANCYGSMFYNCSRLNYIKCLATNPNSNYSSAWMYGTASSGTFVKASSASWSRNESGIKSGWTVQSV